MARNDPTDQLVNIPLARFHWSPGSALKKVSGTFEAALKRDENEPPESSRHLFQRPPGLHISIRQRVWRKRDHPARRHSGTFQRDVNSRRVPKPDETGSRPPPTTIQCGTEILPGGFAVVRECRPRLLTNRGEITVFSRFLAEFCAPSCRKSWGHVCGSSDTLLSRR